MTIYALNKILAKNVDISIKILQYNIVITKLQNKKGEIINVRVRCK